MRRSIISLELISLKSMKLRLRQRIIASKKEDLKQKISFRQRQRKISLEWIKPNSMKLRAEERRYEAKDKHT